MSCDYVEQRGKDGRVRWEDHGRSKTRIGIDRENAYTSAIVVKKKKRLDPFAVDAVGGEVGIHIQQGDGQNQASNSQSRLS